MLSRKYQKLRLNSKGNLKKTCSNAKGITPSQLLPGIPVLSISALLVIFTTATNLSYNSTYATSDLPSISDNLTSDISSNDSQISPQLNDTATISLSIDNSTVSQITDNVDVILGKTHFIEHTITIKGENIQSANLILSGPTTIPATDSAGNVIPGGTILGKDYLPLGFVCQDALEIASNGWGYAWDSYDDWASIKDGTCANGLEISDLEINQFSPSGDKLRLNSPDSTHQLNQTTDLIFAANFAEGSTPGHYIGEITLALTATPAELTTYSITYDANGGTGTSPATQTINTYDQAYQFTAASQGNLTRSGYQFLGWSESNAATTATYTAGSTISLTASAPAKTLYAVWEKLNGITTVTKMQDLYTGNDNGISQICANSTVGDTNTLTDSRDGNTYTVRKHSDGNCWMTQNLRLVGPLSLTPSDSNVTSNYTLPSSSVSGYNSSYLYLSQMYYGNNTTRGAYYSFTAATAGTGNADLSTGDAASSICPKGWVLPSNTDYRTLLGVAGYNTTTMQSTPYNFVIAGFVVDSSNTTGSEGDYWTRTAGGVHGFRLNFNSTGIDVNVYYRSCGFSVRCVAYSN